ncbi:hypothetical protein DICSQDRAFT_85257 [Dichomitus squalens LYAD-421 SS1]|uniref:RING-type domain-containing protein n=1 Tax=Dichomitus squalens (strain LYAD-421) TaxID=732165 RepID=R7T1W9_DICSQ|nr:uncharacterized protein DICSQDRAFT_85257 [Dichomitus squalens LYAD-421 SS1]EJF62371.1 hypothetical protein DICSQDRAFT_85257 [Dichomitus squalens LYAD-421 SS1]
MSVRRASKGKKRAVEDTLSEEEQTSDSSSPDATDAPQSTRTREKQPAVPVKKPKRAETRRCPVCDEAIPLRLLGKHANLETERLEEIIRSVGSTEVLGEAEPEDSSSARTRRSALKARQSLKPGSSSTSEAILEQTMKTLRMLKKHRKQRHAKLRELTREDEDNRWWGTRQRGADGEGEGQVCPVCAKFVKGDVDVVEAHVDSCLAFLRLTTEEEERRRGQARERKGSADAELDGDIDIDGDDGHYGVMEGASFQGTGFDIRNRNDQDVDEDIDVDGEDEVLFGAPQFTEHDVLAPSVDPAEVSGAQSDAGTEADVDVDGAVASGGTEAVVPERDPRKGKSLKDLVAEGKVVRQQVEDAKRMMDEVMGVGDAEQVDLAVELARRSGDRSAMVRALENKVKLLESTKVSSSTSLLCRICLDPYSEPTVSTGCWHTCCRECWLRCLGSTKLCPICKRITGAADLRRVYL